MIFYEGINNIDLMIFEFFNSWHVVCAIMSQVMENYGDTFTLFVIEVTLHM